MFLVRMRQRQQEQKQSNADNQDQNQNQGQNGDSSDFDPFNDKNNPAQDRDLLDRGENSEQTIKDILKSFKEAKDIDKMSPEERNDYLNKKAQKEFDESHNITENERKESDRIKNKISIAGLLCIAKRRAGLTCQISLGSIRVLLNPNSEVVCGIQRSMIVQV